MSSSMSADEFRSLCGELDLTAASVARLMGSKERPVLRWADGTRAVPEGVALVLRITKAVRGRTRYSQVAKLLAGETERFDKLAAEWGDYPSKSDSEVEPDARGS